MIKLSTYYQRSEDSYFNFDYYRSTHFKLAETIFSQYGLVYIEIDQFLTSVNEKSPSHFAATHAYFETLQHAKEALLSAGLTLLLDLRNYTNAKPLVNLCEVTRSGSRRESKQRETKQLV